MPGGIHHVVHAVRDLDAAGDIYRRLGFQVGWRNRHPWGTENRIVQLGGSYIELLRIAEPQNIPPHETRRFSFGAFNRDFLSRQEGLSMLALESRDAEADAETFRRAGIGDFDVYHFEREGRGPDGHPVKVAFSLAFARDAAAPEAGFFACQEHYPENFWSPAAQRHENAAAGISGIVLVADQPERHREFLAKFSGIHSLSVAGGAIAAETRPGTIEVIDHASFRSRFGATSPEPSPGLRVAAIRFAVADFAAAAAALQRNVEAQVRNRQVVVGADAAAGATLIFEQASRR
jgi:catechol 2,3-dioxygenase-like lactoylglutathione lyase family enzyme